MSLQIILAVDGHDAAGKTTLASRLAERLGAAYVRPFSGQRGVAMLEAAEAGDTDSAFEIAGKAVEQTLSVNQHAPLIVCDRLWLTVFSLVPQDLHDRWPYLAPLVLCYADLSTTLARLANRDEQAYPQSWHVKYLELYQKLAQRWRCFVVRTDQHAEDVSLAMLVNWAAGEIASRR
jgi:thymidylate kinase